MKSIDQFLEESDAVLERNIASTKKTQIPAKEFKPKVSSGGMKLVEQAIKEVSPAIKKEPVKENTVMEPKKNIAKPIQVSKPAPVPAPVTESIQSEFDVGGVINELVSRIKDTENTINGLTENIKVLTKEKADRPKYSFTVKRDKDGKIESVLAAPASEGN